MGPRSADDLDPLAVTVGDAGHAEQTTARIDETRPADDDDPELEDSLIQAIAAAPPIPVERDRLPPGTILGEGFRIERVLGAGAMGVVYEALDLALDRHVAIKLHTQEQGDARSSRMWREAKAMARLSHPNVIAVHEVGEHEGRVFIAMELVEGGSVRDWLKKAPASGHPWREVVRVFLQAAEGLAAAHTVELIHRDFKPDNILLGDDGRVRVADFGLARAATDEPDPVVRPPSTLIHSPSITDRLTQTGATVGTPAYMPPEQITGGPVDHRSDQFSFCVALYEALYGHRPFDARTMVDLLDLITHDEVTPPPSDRDVPGWIHAVVLRGIRSDPAARFESMKALLVALRADPSRRRRRVALGVGVVAALGLTAWVTRVASTTPTPCRDVAQSMAERWNPAAAERIEQAMVATGSPLAAEAVDRVRPALSDYADAWGRQRVEACRATRVRGEQSEALLDRRMACLDRRQQQFDAVVAVLGTPDADVVEHAVEALGALGPLHACEDLASLQAQVPLPEDATTREDVADTRARIAAIAAAFAVGQASTMGQEADAVVERAAALGYPPLSAEAHLARYWVRSLLDEREPSIDDAAAAHRWATQAGDARIAWKAALALARQIGRSVPTTPEALRWLETAEGWAHRFDLDVSDHSDVARARGEVLQHGDRVDEAIAVLEDSLQWLEQHSAPTGDLAGHHVGLAYLLGRVGRHDEAKQHIDRGIPLQIETYGDVHPQVANGYSILAQIHNARGAPESALEAIEQGLTIRRTVHGENTPGYASGLRERGDTLTALGRLEPAVADYERALAILDALPHADPSESLITINNLANTLDLKGDREQALQATARSLPPAIEAFGADSLRVAQIRLNYGGFLGQAGRAEEGLEQTRLAIATLEKTFGPTHPHVGVARLNRVMTYIDQERLPEAREELDLATAIFTENFDPGHFWLARVARVEALMLEAQGQPIEALARWRDAVTQLEAALGSGNAGVIRARLSYGALLVKTGDPQAAIEPLRTALRDSQASGLNAVTQGHIRYRLARALWSDPASHAEARELLAAAIPQLEDDDPEQIKKIRQWLSQGHPPRSD